ncbi:MAG: transglycosylase domain-containing protein [Gammaproteobacteria bacterium]|nr:transglycosylase domain-containing protein [Gammaproteobacteria bacterium]
MSDPVSPTVKPVIKKLLRYAAGVFLGLFLLGLLTVGGLYLYIAPKLPDIESLSEVRLQVPLRVYTRSGDLIAEFGEMKRNPIKYKEYPPLLIQAVTAAEDDRFFEHHGVDYKGILRATLNQLTEADKSQGGSTITMQVARNFFLSREKTYMRKLNEIFLAMKIENQLTKNEILELYLNKIYLGKRAYGFSAAAQVYYGKNLNELTIGQTAMLAGLPQAPSRSNPITSPSRAIQRRNYVLKRMQKLEIITPAQYEQAVAEKDPASMHGVALEIEAPYVAEMVRAEMLARYGNETYTAGLEVYTTLDKQLQNTANTALRGALLTYDRRHGYRGRIQHIDLMKSDDMQDLGTWHETLADVPTVGGLIPALVFEVDDEDAYAYTQNNEVAYLPWDHLDWARRYIDDNHIGPEIKKASDVLKPGDVIYVAKDQPGCSWLAQAPKVEGSIVALNPTDGATLALVGGFEYSQSKFNRVTQAQRQPGSAFKPFIYSAALDKGFTPATIVNDAPVVFDAPGLEDTWRPENYSGEFYGPTRLRMGLAKSRNLVSIRVLRDIGIGYALQFVQRFGFEKAILPRDLSLALGSGTLTPLELARGYAVFANGGLRIEPYYIDYIVGPDKTVIDITNPLVACASCVPDDVPDVTNTPGVEQHPPALADAIPAPVAATASPTPTLTPSPALAVTDPPLASNAIANADEPEVLPLLPSSDTEANLDALLKKQLTTAQGPPVLRPAPRALSPQTTFLISSMMRDVIRMGTGQAARALNRNDLAGKTGTTNDQRDAWFAGFNRDIVAVTWVGFDDPRPLGNQETGAKAALPMWMDFMRVALQGKPEALLPVPPKIVSVRINSNSGQPTTADDPDAMFEYFVAGRVPTEPHRGRDNPDPHNQQAPSSDVTDQLF